MSTELSLALRALGATSVRPVDTCACARGLLPAPDAVFVTDVGAAIAWYRNRPFVAHPTLEDLLALHGLGRRLDDAA